MTERKKQKSRFLIYPKKTRVRAEPGARRVGANYYDGLSKKQVQEILKMYELWDSISGQH